MSISGLGTPLGYTSDSAGDVLSGAYVAVNAHLLDERVRDGECLEVKAESAHWESKNQESK